MSHQTVPQAITQAITEYINIQGKHPAGLLLGYGTYINLCRECDQFESADIPHLTKFYGLPITVDPQQESRITLLHAINQWEAAIESLRRRGEPGLRINIQPTSYAIREDVEKDLVIAKYSRLRDDYFPIGGWLG